MGVGAEKTAKNCKKLMCFSQKLTTFLRKLAKIARLLMPFGHFLALLGVFLTGIAGSPAMPPATPKLRGGERSADGGQGTGKCKS